MLTISTNKLASLDSGLCLCMDHMSKRCWTKASPFSASAKHAISSEIEKSAHKYKSDSFIPLSKCTQSPFADDFYPTRVYFVAPPINTKPIYSARIEWKNWKMMKNHCIVGVRVEGRGRLSMNSELNECKHFAIEPHKMRWKCLGSLRARPFLIPIIACY